MPEYLKPGVYVEDGPGGARPIQAVTTSTPAFFGIAFGSTAAPRAPTFVTSAAEYGRRFSAPFPGDTLANAVRGFFQNGGSGCYVVDLGAGHTALGPEDLALIDPIEGISLVAAPGYTDMATYEALIAHCEARNRFAILDTPLDIDPLERLTRPLGHDGGLHPPAASRGHAAFYVPWIEILDAARGERVMQPPSGHLAGVYARVDAQRGVHKAPANTTLRGAIGLARAISSCDQEMLNPVGANCIRQFPDGIRVWGARTLADPASEWCYVPVRRLTSMIERSIEHGTQWVVFEPNDEPLWKSVRRDVGAFLNALWRDGALAGTSADQAYFVRCDRTTMTQADIDAGRLVMLVGVAPTRPAEFVIIRITQQADASTFEES